MAKLIRPIGTAWLVEKHQHQHQHQHQEREREQERNRPEQAGNPPSLPSAMEADPQQLQLHELREALTDELRTFIGGRCPEYFSQNKEE